MKQILQNLSSGETRIIEAPTPAATAGSVLIDTRATLISAGTERMLVDFGKSSLLDKARQQPEKVRQVLDKMRTDGVLSTLDAVRSKLSQPLPLGYCNVGVVAAVGAGVQGFAPGDRVVSNGPHADVVRVPQTLCAKIPEGVSDESAAFVVLASIGLQGIRLAQPTLGESFVVTGAGLIGLLVVQLLHANGCRVLAIDFDESRLALARQFGAQTCNPGRAEDPVTAGIAFSGGRGVDGVIITASTASSDPVTQAARMSRKRGRIVLVGVTGLELNRADFYEKELTFQVSCSYGPGRYDPGYEERGNDYPLGFVRWTEQRNFEAVLDLLAQGALDVQRLVTHRFEFDAAATAYEKLVDDSAALGIVLNYSSPPATRHAATVALRSAPSYDAAKPVIGVVGAGNYASRVLIPAFRSAGAQLHTVVTSGGTSAAIHGERAGFAAASSDFTALLAQAAVNTVVIATRHDSHAHLVARALGAGKHVFVEKPLAIDSAQLAEVEAAYQGASPRPQLMIGFNRRFAPQVVRMATLLGGIRAPKAFVMTVNAGAIPSGHWTQDPAVGGGRIIGEGCHFVDLMRHLAGSEVVSVQARRMETTASSDGGEDKAAITLGFADGSFGTIHYLANGAASFPKERIEVFVDGRVLQIDNFRRMRGFGWSGFRRYNLWRQDKGQQACAAAFLRAVESGVPAIPPDQIFEVARVTIEAATQLRRQ